MKKSHSRSVLHLQLGQEVIYLLLTTFAVMSLILALFLILRIRNESDYSRQQGRAIQTQQQKIDAAQKEIDMLKGTIATATGSRTMLNDLGQKLQQQSRE